LKNVINVEALNERYRVVTFGLALLNVFDGVNSASRMNKLPYYQLPTAEEKSSCQKYNIFINLGLPIIYQEACIYYVYAEWYQAKQLKKFKDFMQEAIERGKAAEEESIKLRESNVLHLHDWLMVPEMPIDIKTLPGESPYAIVLTPNAAWYVERSSNRCEELPMTPDAIQSFLTDHKLTDCIAQEPVLLDINFSDVSALTAKLSSNHGNQPQPGVIAATLFAPPAPPATPPQTIFNADEIKHIQEAETLAFPLDPALLKKQ
jgi:hypothetical protein